MKIANCIITKIDSIIITDYNISNGSVKLCPGIDISAAKHVYSVCPGKVIFIGHSDYYGIAKNTYRLVIQYDSGNLFGYDLATVSVNFGDTVDYQSNLGTCDDNILHFEHYNTYKTNAPIRINGNVYYKQNPLPILIDGYESIYNYASGLSANTNSVWYADKILTENELKHLTR